MEFLTDWATEGSLFALATAVLFRVRRAWAAAREGAELLTAVNALAFYVQQDADWTAGDTKRAVELAEQVRKEAAEFVRAAKAVL